jgi:AcrR family transcriptional regulator
MPYTKSHKLKTRESIIGSARILFNRHGFASVTIDMVMQHAGLTRGGFYNHFCSKQALYSEAVDQFLMGRGAKWREDAGVDLTNILPETAKQMLKSYLSNDHLQDIDGQCPMIALPSDVSRAGEEAQGAYQKLLEAMIWLFEQSLLSVEKPIESTLAKTADKAEVRHHALTLSALSIGGMVIAKALPDSMLADEVRKAAHGSAEQLLDNINSG